MADNKQRSNKFLVLQLLTIIRRYQMEHMKASSKMECDCGVCVAARRLIKQLDDEPKWSK